ncbi:MAG: transglycosylase domain-containing protein [Pseudomonadota bacterium]
MRGLRRWALRGLAALALWVAAYGWVDPPTTLLILSERWRLGDVAHAGPRLRDLPPLVRLAFPAAEDARVCAHWGIDLEAVADAVAEARAGGRLRGASTLAQQVAKNAFLWPGRDWARKGLEAALAPALDLAWGKRRVLEVYLGVAEMGPGVFGLEAAARAHFGRAAAELSPRQAALIAAALPNPKERDPARPSAFLARRAAAIEGGARTLLADGRGSCLLDR